MALNFSLMENMNLSRLSFPTGRPRAVARTERAQKEVSVSQVLPVFLILSNSRAKALPYTAAHLVGINLLPIPVPRVPISHGFNSDKRQERAMGALEVINIDLRGALLRSSCDSLARRPCTAGRSGTAMPSSFSSLNECNVHKSMSLLMLKLMLKRLKSPSVSRPSRTTSQFFSRPQRLGASVKVSQPIKKASCSRRSKSTRCRTSPATMSSTARLSKEDFPAQLGFV